MITTALNEHAIAILKQRIDKAENARTVRRMRAIHKTQTRIRKTIAVCIKRGVPVENVFHEVLVARTQLDWAAENKS